MDLSKVTFDNFSVGQIQEMLQAFVDLESEHEFIDGQFSQNPKQLNRTIRLYKVDRPLWIVIMGSALTPMLTSEVAPDHLREAGPALSASRLAFPSEEPSTGTAERKAGTFRATAGFAQKLKVGDGLDQRTQMGPVANPRRLNAMAELTKDAVDRGATLLTGGQRIGEVGNFWQPTVLNHVPLDAKVFNDEPFGPMAAIRSFETLDEAIAEANRLPYGLAGYAFTRSLKNADLLARHLEVGMLWINIPAMPSAEMPFGGLKDSGYGTEGGPEALEAYLNVRAVAIMNV